MTLGQAYGGSSMALEPYRAHIRHIASGSSPVAMSVNASPQDFNLPDFMGEFGAPFVTYSAPEFTIDEAGTYRVELLVHWEATVDPPVSPDAQVLVALDTGSGYATLFRCPVGDSDEDDARDQSYNTFVLALAAGDKLKVQEHELNSPTISLESVTLLIQKLA